MDKTKTQGSMVPKAIKYGIIKALRTALMLIRIMAPIYAGVTLLRHTEFFMWLAVKIEPAMRIFGLPGEAVVPLVVGAFSDEYAVVAAMSGFSFNMSQITIIAMIVLAFHGLPVETVIARKIGIPALRIALFRICLAVSTGLIVALLCAAFLGGNMPGTLPEPGSLTTTPVISSETSEGVIASETSEGVIASEATQSTTASAGIFDAGWRVILVDIVQGILKSVLILMRVLLPLMIGIELLMTYRIIEKMAVKLGFFIKILGIGKEALLPLLIGLFLGVTFGAGTIMEMNRERPLPRRDLMLVAVFIFSCHGIIEAAYLFTLAGGNTLILSALRFAIAVGVTAAAGRLILREE